MFSDTAHLEKHRCNLLKLNLSFHKIKWPIDKMQSLNGSLFVVIDLWWKEMGKCDALVNPDGGLVHLYKEYK